ncbi:MAG: hypothetical protein NTZ49_04845 [Candidatus Parcubacteria bacterium]|nr:hypothetical protein [Candidatus Parcubacteria bacterium]
MPKSKGGAGLKIYCIDCQISFPDTEESLAKAEVNDNGRPTGCPRCKKKKIAVIYDIKKAEDRKRFLEGEKNE